MPGLISQSGPNNIIKSFLIDGLCQIPRAIGLKLRPSCGANDHYSNRYNYPILVNFRPVSTICHENP